MKKLHIANSPLTNTIFVGTLLKCGKVWSSNKQDLTMGALVSVAEHVLSYGQPVIIKNNGIPEYEISVKKLLKG